MLTKERRVQIANYLERRKTYSKNWRSKNREKLAGYRKAWYAKLKKDIQEFKSVKVKK